MLVSIGVPTGGGGPSGGVGGPPAGIPAKQKPKQKNIAIEFRSVFGINLIGCKNKEFIPLAKVWMSIFISAKGAISHRKEVQKSR